MTNEIYLFGTVGHPYEYGGEIYSDRVMAFLDDNKDKDVTIYLSSEGGDFFEGVNISNLLKRHNGKVTTYVLGQSASAGSVITMGSDEIIMDSNSSMLIHNSRTFAYGTKEDFKALTKSLTALDEGLYNTYKDRFNGTDEELRQLLNEDRYLSSTEALEYNLCDKVDNFTKDIDNNEFLNYANTLDKGEVNKPYNFTNREKVISNLEDSVKELTEQVERVKDKIANKSEKNEEENDNVEEKSFTGIFNKFSKK